MVYVRNTNFPRDKMEPGKVLCEYCSAKCCKYFALAIDTPEDRAALDLMRWYVLHRDTTVFIEDGSWYLLVHTQCKHLQDDNRCGIYETRPQICRDYTTEECEYEDEYVYDHYFETSEQIAEYMDARFPLEGRENFRSPKPALLPVIG